MKKKRSLIVSNALQLGRMSSRLPRHLVMMPHIERSNFPWNWAYYPEQGIKDEVSPWHEAFVNARKWIEKK